MCADRIRQITEKISAKQPNENAPNNRTKRAEEIFGENRLKPEDIAFLICRGGWPRATDMKGEAALEQAFDYYDAVARSDISRVDGVNRNTERVKRLMRSYARNQGAQVSYAAICADMAANENDAMDADTVYSYLTALKKIFVVEDMQAWNPNLRSKTAIRSADTRYFVDPSIASAALGLGPDDLLVEEGVRSLKKPGSLIDTDKMKAPSFRMVLTATGNYAYRRADGVYVVPIGCLKN